VERLANRGSGAREEGTMFGQDWEPAVAKIVARRLDSKGHGGGYDMPSYSVENYEYVLDVRPESGAAPFRATIKDPFNEISFKQPNEGTVVRVKFHPKDHKVKFDRSDPALRAEDVEQRDVAAAHSGDAQAKWDALVGGAPGSWAPGRDSQHRTDSATIHANSQAAQARREQRIPQSKATRAQKATGAGGEEQKLGQLERLAKLHADGALTDAEFAAEKTKLLSS
jgi:hypothetical protein